MLSTQLGMQMISAGDIFRRMAKQHCMSLEEFGLLAKCDQNIDRKIDKMQKKIAQQRNNIILEGRVSGFLVDADLKIWLKAPLEIRAQRIAKREGKSIYSAIKETLERERCERERYIKYYNIDINNLSIYDLVIDSSKWKPEEIYEIVAKAVHYLLRRQCSETN